MATGDGRGRVFGISQRRLQLQSHLETAKAELTNDASPAGEKRSHAWSSVAVLSLGLLLTTTTALALHAFLKTNALRDDLAHSLEVVEMRLEAVDAAVGFDSRRQQLLLGIRDEILATNGELSLHEAYQYSESLLRASEKYPAVDPLMLLSIGIVESRFDRLALSRADARGLYQIWPTTGRILARILEWEYSDELLYDAEANTEMAALYLDILRTAYNDWSMILAEYNGGPLNAGYLRARSALTARETREYVPRVLENFERLRAKFDTHRSVDVKAVHRSAARDGKSFSSKVLTFGGAALETARPSSPGLHRASEVPAARR